jgi:hypothetical protein
MRRLASSALAAALVVVGAAGSAAAQDDMTGRRASLFDLGIYGGGAFSTDWFEIGEEGYAPGVAPIFGAQATYWLSPQFGLRLNGSFMPSNLPEPGDDNFFGEDNNDNYVQNNWFYDLDLVYRPFFWSAGNGFLSSLYLFVGGGGLTTNIAGENPYPGCLPVPQWVANGVCLSSSPTHATVGQGVAGLGLDLFPITSGLGLFLEGAVHGYDSPAHVEEDAQNAEDRFAFTPRLVLGLKASFGNILPPPPPPAPEPLPPPPPPVAPQPQPQPVDQMVDVRVCVVQDGNLTEVTARYNQTRGDTTYNGQPFSTAFPATTGYAANAGWYINNEAITFNNRRYVKYGLPRVLGVTEVSRAGEFQGVSVFSEGGNMNAEVIYIPVRPGCEFQPYQTEIKTGGVRG